MPNPEINIPPERELAYMQNAAEAMEEAAKPVVRELGMQAVAEATGLTQQDAQAPAAAAEAERYTKDSGIVGGAEQHLKQADFIAQAYQAGAENRANLKNVRL